jgi:hypothetical protein
MERGNQFPSPMELCQADPPSLRRVYIIKIVKKPYKIIQWVQMISVSRLCGWESSLKTKMKWKIIIKHRIKTTKMMIYWNRSKTMRKRLVPLMMIMKKILINHLYKKVKNYKICYRLTYKILITTMPMNQKMTPSNLMMNLMT